VQTREEKRGWTELAQKEEKEKAKKSKNKEE